MTGLGRMGVGLATGAIASVLWTSSALATPDAWITTKAKMALLTSEGVDAASSINVDTVAGQVTLHGAVTSDEEKSRAGSVVREVEGARTVRNLLQVVPANVHETVAASDAEIREDVERALADDAVLKSSRITVESVNDGVVLLAGTAPTMSAHLHALQTARKVEDVRQVASEIVSPGRLSEAELDGGAEVEAESSVGKAADAATEQVKRSGQAIAAATDAAGDKVEEFGTTAANAARDMWITSAVKVKLIADERTPALAINVDTIDGIVTLFGTVDSADVKRAAEHQARSVEGVQDVHNDLEVGAGESARKAS